MDASFLSPLLADAGFGVGIASGISAGLVTGFLFGVAGGTSFASKKMRRQLTAAIESGDISVVDKDDQPMKTDLIFGLLKERHDKA